METWPFATPSTMALSLDHECNARPEHSALRAGTPPTDILRTWTFPRERRLLMERVEAILQGDAVMVQPASRRVQNLEAHPSGYHDFHNVWLELA